MRKPRKPLRKPGHRRGTVYAVDVQKTVTLFRKKYGMTYRDISKETGIPLMTLWDIGADPSKNAYTATSKDNVERILDLYHRRVGKDCGIRYFDSPSMALSCNRVKLTMEKKYARRRI